MRLINLTKLSDLQKSTDKIRNICILAHVDHGKTTLADSLVASNGIISPKMVGKLRYLDSRKDEQERGITMKSSSIALYYSTSPEKEFLINLIDSPGHVDFSSEVSTAVRLCDGAIVVVDVVEGVCPQTCVALKQAWLDNVRPVLVLNKIDRLITELKLKPLDAYIHLRQVLEQVNAVTGALFNTEVLSRDATSTSESELTNSGDQNGVYDWSAGFEEEDDSNLYFAPETGNVIFASALDCWGFGIKEFAHFFSQKLGCKEELLRKVLWGDFYLNTKSKRVMKGAQEKAKKPVFVQLVLDNLWALYETVVIRKERDKVSNIVEKLGLKLTPRDLQLTDCKMQLQAITSKWLPLAKAVLDMVCEKLPSPSEIVAEKVEKLMCSKTRSFESLPAETQKLKNDFLACSSNEEAPVIVYISKMFPVERKALPQNRIRPLTSEELAQRRERARARYAELRRNANATTDVEQTLEPDMESIVSDEKAPEQTESEDVFIAFARIFSGKLRKNQVLYVLGPKHDPAIALQRNETIDSSLTLKDLQSGQHITKVTVNDLYLLMGRELESLDEVPAGNVVGIGGLDEHVLKTATLSTTVACPAFTELQIMAEPIVRVAVEPARPVDMPQLIKGLKLLNQADACVQVLLQETGEHVLVTAGEVHLERCLSDLRERYAKIELNASEPIVPFRETIVPPPVVDMVNEAIQEHNLKKKDDSNTGLITVWTANKQICIKIRAVPLPEEVTAILESNKDLLEAVDHFNLQTKQFKSSELGEQLSELIIESTNNGSCSDNDASALTERTLEAMQDLKKKLNETFELSGDEWKNATEQMWSVGPHKCGPNVLLNRVNNYNRSSIWTSRTMISDPRTEFDSSLVNGFQLATLAGPLCEEPMRGVCFIIEDWTLDLSVGDTGVYGPLSGQVMSAAKEGCRKAFQARPQRLMAAMYSCNITVNAEVLGKMYAVLGRRHGRVLGGDMTQGSATFTITAVLPVVESFSFAPEIRKQTSGLASPQLVFSHWETIDIDPFWTPSTEEEYLHFGEKSDTVNRARRYMDGVRKRKGLPVEEKIIEHAEKQRTLSKNK